MPKPKGTNVKENCEVLFVRIKPENKEWIEEQAYEKGLSLSQYIDFWVDRMKKKAS